MTPVLYTASFGYLKRHPWQLGLAILGICVGVAVMVAIDLANQSARKAFLLSMDTLNGQTTHQVVGGPGGVDERLYTSLRIEHGYRNIAPVVEGYVTIGDEALRLLGVDVFAERDFRNYTSPGDTGADLADTGGGPDQSSQRTIRALLNTPGALLMSAETAHRLGAGSGSKLRVSANGKEYAGYLAATWSGERGERLAGVVVTDISTAQEWLAMSGRLSRIDVRIEEGEAIGKLERRLPPGATLSSAAGRTRATVDMSNAFMTNLTAMSLLAMLVGIFLIYNSVAFAVLQRRDLIGILRALGVTRTQMFRLIVGEAAILGVVGAALGVGVGLWLGEHLLALVARTVTDHYFRVTVTDLDLDLWSVGKGLLAGILATIVAAIMPAVEAASYRPRLSLARSGLERAAGRLAPRLAAVGILLMLAATVAIAASGDNLVAGLAALFALILGFALCIPVVVRWLSRLFEPLAGRLAGTPGRLAVGGVAGNLSRTGVAIVALAVAVSATIGVTVMVDSFRSSVGDWLVNTLSSDVYVGVAGGSLDPELIPELTAIEGIREFSTSRRAWLETPTGRTRVIAIDMAAGSYAGTRLRSDDADAAWGQFDAGTGILVSDSYAYRHRTGEGDTLSLETASGVVSFTIAAVYQSYDSNDGAIMISRAAYDRHFDDPSIDSIGLYLEQGVDPDDIMASLREVAAGRQALIMDSNASIRELSLGIFDRTFVITNVLYWLAVGVAIIGILGAMLALQLERAREFGVLRAIGMTPVQTSALVISQSGFIGFLAGLAAAPLGLVLAWVLIKVINRRAFGWQIELAASPEALAWAMALAIGAALAAGIYPSVRAAATRPALAMREE